MPNEIYGELGTRVTFESSGGDEPFTLTSLASGAGRISDQYDRGADPQPVEYVGALRLAFAVQPTVNNLVRIYFGEGWELRQGGTPTIDQPGQLGAADAAVSDEDSFNNWDVVGTLYVPPSASTNQITVPIPPFTSFARYLQFGVWNAADQAFSSTAGDFELAIWPAYREIQ